MSIKTTRHFHNPLHIYADDTFYFVSAETLNHAPFLAAGQHKKYLQTVLLNLAPDYGLELSAWVILNNHYHILFRLRQGETLGKFIKQFHPKTAAEFNRLDNQPGRKIWWNYWDWCIRSQTDYWRHFNYIHYNPVKHGYISQLRDWPYSSLPGYVEA